MSIKYGDGKNSHAMTTSRGYDVNYRPQLSHKKSAQFQMLTLFSLTTFSFITGGI